MYMLNREVAWIQFFMRVGMYAGFNVYKNFLVKGFSNILNDTLLIIHHITAWKSRLAFYSFERHGNEIVFCLSV
jgi:hypothetical protein